MRHYDFQHCGITAAEPVVVGQARGHYWFPSLHVLGKSDLLCEVVVTADKAQGKWPAVLHRSRDGGASWEKALSIESYGPSSTPVRPDGLLLMPYELWPLSPGDKRNAMADGTLVVRSADGSVQATSTAVKFLGFPRDLADYHQGELLLLTNGNILPQPDGRLFSTVYGKFVGDAKYSTMAVTSDDGGSTWRYCSIVAGGADVLSASEGPDESNTVRLDDGRLLCVYRVGGRQPYHKSYSADEGTTWTKPAPMDGVWSVEPQLARLDNGLLVLSGGRPGLFLWICADAEGNAWTRFNLAEHHNALMAEPALRYSEEFCAGQQVFTPYQSTSYTGLKPIGPDEALVCYDRLANGWNGAPGPWGDADAVFAVRIKARRSA